MTREVDRWVVYDQRDGSVWQVTPPTMVNAEHEAKLAGQGHIHVKEKVGEMLANAYSAGRVRGVHDRRDVDGNPHYANALGQDAAWGQVQATLALVYEQRTANIIALLESEEKRIVGDQEYRQGLKAAIRRRLGT